MSKIVLGNSKIVLGNSKIVLGNSKIVLGNGKMDFVHENHGYLPKKLGDRSAEEVNDGQRRFQETEQIGHLIEAG
jgi:hypothetical protein